VQSTPSVLPAIGARFWVAAALCLSTYGRHHAYRYRREGRPLPEALAGIVIDQCERELSGLSLYFTYLSNGIIGATVMGYRGRLAVN